MHCHGCAWNTRCQRHSCSVRWHAGHDHHADRLSRCQRHSNCRSRLRARRPQPARTAHNTNASAKRLRERTEKKSEEQHAERAGEHNQIYHRTAMRTKGFSSKGVRGRRHEWTDGGDRGRGRGAARGAVPSTTRGSTVDHNKTRPLYSRVARDLTLPPPASSRAPFLGDFCRSRRRGHLAARRTLSVNNCLPLE